MSQQLPIPPAATEDKHSVEMIRVWIANRRPWTALNIGFWEERDSSLGEPEAWGMLLADTVRHIANAHEKQYGRDARETLRRIREAFETELARPTSEHPGDFQDE